MRLQRCSGAGNGCNVSLHVGEGICLQHSQTSGASEHLEMDIKAESGLTTAQIIRAATVEAARAMRVDATAGLVPPLRHRSRDGSGMHNECLQRRLPQHSTKDSIRPSRPGEHRRHDARSVTPAACNNLLWQDAVKPWERRVPLSAAYD
jgi:hypothetical protein